MRQATCEGCGKSFKARHNKGVYVRHCSRTCAATNGTWRGSNGGTWQGDDIGYSAAHMRLQSQRGNASQHVCVDCGIEASHWSVNRDAPRLREQHGWPYSPDPMDYVPRCVGCHKRYDLHATMQPGGFQ